MCVGFFVLQITVIKTRFLNKYERNSNLLIAEVQMHWKRVIKGDGSLESGGVGMIWESGNTPVIRRANAEEDALQQSKKY